MFFEFTLLVAVVTCVFVCFNERIAMFSNVGSPIWNWCYVDIRHLLMAMCRPAWVVYYWGVPCWAHCPCSYLLFFVFRVVKFAYGALSGFLSRHDSVPMLRCIYLVTSLRTFFFKGIKLWSKDIFLLLLPNMLLKLLDFFINFVKHSETLGLWTLSIVRNSKQVKEHNVTETESVSFFR
jgi:hypothetical protein